MPSMKSGDFRSKQLMVRYFLIFIMSLVSSGCLAASPASNEVACSGRTLDDLYSSYVIYHAVRYGGGLTSESSAEARIGENVLVGRSAFQARDFSISDPLYEVTCYSAPKEGNVDSHRWSNFYGYGPDREVIKVLHVYTNGEVSKEPTVNLEIFDEELWEMHDGWLYMMRPVRKQRPPRSS